MKSRYSNQLKITAKQLKGSMRLVYSKSWLSNGFFAVKKYLLTGENIAFIFDYCRKHKIEISRISEESMEKINSVNYPEKMEKAKIYSKTAMIYEFSKNNGRYFKSDDDYTMFDTIFDDFNLCKITGYGSQKGAHTWYKGDLVLLPLRTPEEENIDFLFPKPEEKMVEVEKNKFISEHFIISKVA